MSSRIRQAIGLTKRRLQDVLNLYETIQSDVEASPEPLSEEALYDLFEKASDAFDRLRRHVHRMETLTSQWNALMDKDPMEEQIHAEYVERYGNYNEVLEKGRLAVDHLRRRLLRLRETVARRLDIADLDEDPMSEGTLTGLPQNDEVFSTPQRTATHTPTPATSEPERHSLPLLSPPSETAVEPNPYPIPAPPMPNWTDMLFLPNVTIPTFNGNPSRWNEFWDLFNAMIHNRSLEPCVKLFHLRSHLEGEARASLAHLGNSNLDYPIAIQTLTDMYGDPLRVTHRLRSEILHFKMDDKGASNLYKGWARLHQLYSQLRAMGDPADTTLLGQVLESKFPRYVLQKVYKNGQTPPKGHQILVAIGEVLRKEANIDRMIADNRAEFTRNRPLQKPQFQRRPADPVLTHFTQDKKDGKIKCHLCDDEHLTYRCSKYNDARDRSRRVKEKGLCRNCLQPGHFAKECKGGKCRHCQQQHHSTLCFRNDPSAEGTTKSRPGPKKVTFDKSRAPAPKSYGRPPKKAETNAIINEDELEAEEQTFAASLLKSGESVLLMTVEAQAVNPQNPRISTETTVFLDNGSTKSYVTDELAQKLQLKPISQEILRVNTFGSQTPHSYTSTTYEIGLRNLRGSKTDTYSITVSALPRLTTPMNIARRDNLMSDHLAFDKIKPSILIGMDHHDLFQPEDLPTSLPSGFNLAKSPIGPLIYGKGKTKIPIKLPQMEAYHAYNSSSDNEVAEEEPMEMEVNSPDTERAIETPWVRRVLKKSDRYGYLIVLSGSMWAGKTSELIRFNKLLEPFHKNILNLKSVADTRYSENLVTSHDGEFISAHAVTKLCEANNAAYSADVICIDEIHLFEDAPEFLREHLNPGKLILVAGLMSGEDLDPIMRMAPVNALADEIWNLKANCALCNGPAPFTKRLRDLAPNESPIGGSELYQPRCRNCYYLPVDHPLAYDDSVGPTHSTYSIVANDPDLDTDLPLIEDNENDKLQRDLTKFWALEHLGVLDDPLRNDDDMALATFRKSVTRTSDGRYICSWPWKMDNGNLPSNFNKCLGRLRSTLRRLQHDTDLYDKYDRIIQEQLKLNIIEEVALGQRDGPIHYIPHQPVITPQKTTTKVRIVYDASCKTSNGKSLNDYLFRGPVLLPELPGMLLRFRATPIPLLADVEKAFLQLELKLSDRDATRFLWVRDRTKPPDGNNLILYRFQRVPFGFISSPFLLAATIDQHLSNYPHPLAQQMRRSTYVDNILIEAKTAEEGIGAYHQSRKIFAEAQMNLREFQSSDPTVKNFLETEGMPVPDEVKVLGVPWNTVTDSLALPPPKREPNTGPSTKRDILKVIASFFDPLGIACPVTTQAKMLLQVLWKHQKKWDEPLSTEQQSQWEAILPEIQEAMRQTIPRRLVSFIPTEYQLHVFCDASPTAYSTVAYLRAASPERVEVSFLIGKARVCPVKEVTIPRLELMAALIASTLAKTATQELHPIQFDKTYIWTDSTIALAWIHSTRTLPVFIRNRVTTIWKNTPLALIQYVTTAENPADCATRSLTASEYRKSRWLLGPKWLKDPPEQWPAQKERHLENEENMDLTAFAESDKEDIPRSTPIDFERFSKWSKLVYVMITVLTCLRVKIWSKLSNPSPRLTTLIKTFDPETDKTTKFMEAERIIFRMIQRAHPPSKSIKTSLHLIPENDGLLRCQTRLARSTLPMEATSPIYLPPKSRGTRLYIIHVHQNLKHASPTTTLCALRLRVWIPKARMLVMQTIRLMCTECRTLQAFKLPDFPPYPSTRMNPNPPFFFTGVDYGGPIQVQLTKTEVTKSWICLFTCLTSRAIHLELVFDLSTLAFLQALRRFISRRGAPAEIWSDNATNFKAADKVVIAAWTESESSQHYLATHGIRWNYITESAPWQGGTWERLMGMTKTALKKAIGRRKVTLPEMITLLTEVEAVINSRPLTYVPSGEHTNVIRPIDCIQPGARIGVPILNAIEDGKTYEPNPSLTTQLIDLWRKQQQILTRFWDTWKTEYLLSLTERTQTQHHQSRSAISRTPIPGEVVILGEENIPRSKWRLAQVLEIIKPTRIKLRMADRTNRIVYRPPKSIYPLELAPDPPVANPSNPAETTDQPIPKPPRRSARLREKAQLLTLTLLSLVTLPTVIATNSSTTECNAEDCAPWRWTCCTATQKTGLLIWAGILIALIPTVIFLLSILICLLRLSIKSMRLAWKHRPCPRTPRNRRYPPQQQRMRQLLRRMRTSVALMSIVGLSTVSQACSDTAVLTASNTECHLDDETMIETCALTQSLQTSLRPVGESTCLLVNTPNNQTTQWTITTTSLHYRCNYKLWYYTRDYKTNVEAVHRCRNAAQSTCFDNWCEEVKPDGDVNEFSSPVRKAPGHSHCTRSCGCATCAGCGLCEPSCLFWRLYAEPIGHHTYEVGECPTWILTADVTVTHQNRTHYLTLYPGKPATFWNVTLTLQAATLPVLPILSKPFITDTTSAETMISEASPPGQPTQGSIGTFQCATFTNADDFEKCTFPEAICSCAPSNFNTICSCNYVNPQDVITKAESRLPLTSGPVTISSEYGHFVATLNQQSSILLHVEFQNASLSTLVYDTTCDVEVSEQLNGCRSCHNGATAPVHCQSPLPTVMDIECPDQPPIQLPCDNNTHVISIFTEEEKYDGLCNYSCSRKSNGTFRLQGELTSVTISPLTDKVSGYQWFKPATSVPVSKIIQEVTTAIQQAVTAIFGFLIHNPIVLVIIGIALVILYCILRIYFAPQMMMFSRLAPKRRRSAPTTRYKTKPHRH